MTQLQELTNQTKVEEGGEVTSKPITKPGDVTSCPPTSEIITTTTSSLERVSEVKESGNLKIESNKSEPNTEPVINKKRPKLTNVSNKDKTVELRQGKLNFVEPKINYQIHPSTIIELGHFHMAKYSSQTLTSTQFEEYLKKYSYLIGKLIHESDLLLPELSKYVKEILCPTSFDIKDPWQDAILPSMIENVINEIAERVAYSIILENIDGAEPLTSESLSVYRWEVRDVQATFDSSLVPGILARKEKRVQMKNEAQVLYDELPEDERAWMVSTSSLKKRRKVEHCTSLLNSKDLTTEPKPIIKTPVLKQSVKTPAKPVVEEKPVPKSTISIRGFFSPVRKSQKSPEQVVPDYQKFFHPFRIKQNVSLAKSKNVYVQLLEDFEKAIYPQHQVYVNIDSGDFLKEFLLKCQQQKQMQSDLECPKHVTINLDESDDDDSCAAFDPADGGVRPKLLHFHENYRPAFFGAWPRESNVITGRKFLSKDTELLDYDFDSEEEWQEEEEGELLADSEEDEEDDEDFNDKEDGSDSENDDWIITEDEEVSQVGSDNEQVTSGKSRVKNRKMLHLKPIIYGVCFDTTTASTVSVTKGQLLTTLSYRTLSESTTFPIDPFSTIPIEPPSTIPIPAPPIST